jgi:DNA-directed RNA polymerase subunit RPC12/RpoP
MKSNHKIVSSANLNFAQIALENLLENSYNNISTKLDKLKPIKSKKCPIKLNDFSSKKFKKEKSHVSSNRKLLLKYFWRKKRDVKYEKKFTPSINKLSEKTSVQKIFECLECGKQLTTSDGHKTHLRIHTGEKPYACNLCEKRFSQRNGLKQHLRAHSGERPFACNTCEKKFTQPSSLKYHLRIHTGEKPYPCSQCDKKFTTFRYLKKHLKLHTS